MPDSYDDTVPIVRPLPSDQSAIAVKILCEAFHDYPIMHYVLGAGQADYD